MHTKSSKSLRQIASALPEERARLELSQNELALFSGVSSTTIRKLERGGHVHPELVLRLAVVLAILKHHELKTAAGVHVVPVSEGRAA